MVDLKGIEPSNLTDANRALSQLSYRPKLALFTQKKLQILDFSNIRFLGKSPTNRTGKQGGKIGPDVSRYECGLCALPAELQAQVGTFTQRSYKPDKEIGAENRARYVSL